MLTITAVMVLLLRGAITEKHIYIHTLIRNLTNIIKLKKYFNGSRDRCGARIYQRELTNLKRLIVCRMLIN